MEEFLKKRALEFLRNAKILYREGLYNLSIFSIEQFYIRI